MLGKVTRRLIACAGLILLASIAPLRADDSLRVRNALAEDGSVHTLRGQTTRTSASNPVAAGPGRSVAIVASASGTVGDPFFTDTRDRLLASGDFAIVDVIDAGQVSPTLAELLAYDAVLVWSNLDYADDQALGDGLADFVDSGGGVVIAVFANSTTTNGRFLTGRWLTHDYEIVPAASGTTTGNATLGTVHLPAHPLMAGVVSFSGGGGSFRPTTTAVNSAAAIVAEWSDGSTLVAVREDTVGSRVDLGFYPPSNVIAGFETMFWDAATDGAVLITNALRYAADRVPLIPGDSDGDGDVDLVDADEFGVCFTGGPPATVPAGCVTFDFDRDGDVDCLDWLAFQMAWTEVADPPGFAPCTGTIPAVSSWGLLVMELLVLATATLVFRRRHGICWT